MSRSARVQPKTTGLLASVCLGLLGLIYLQLDEPSLPRPAQSMPSDGLGGSPAPDPHADLEFAMPPRGAYAEIGARPLFSPTRRPPLPTAEATPVPEEPAGQGDRFLLRGTALAGDSRVALLERRATGELLRAREGQMVGGWRVATITPRTVVLQAGDDEDVLEVERSATLPVTFGQFGLPNQAFVGPVGDELEPEAMEGDAIEDEAPNEPFRR